MSIGTGLKARKVQNVDQKPFRINLRRSNFKTLLAKRRLLKLTSELDIKYVFYSLDSCSER